MDETEKEIYSSRRFRRKAWVGLVVNLFALAGLTDGLYALHMLPVDSTVEEGRVHVSCPHMECRLPHAGANNNSAPNGLGSGALCALYLLLCGGIVVYVLDERA